MTPCPGQPKAEIEKPLSLPRFSAIALGFVALGLFAHRPMLLHWATGIPGSVTPGDQDLFVWNFWWVSKALGSPELDLVHCPLIFYPIGFNFFLHSHALAYCLLAFPLIKAGVALPAIFNSFVLAGFVLAGVGMTLFLRELRLPTVAAVVGGMLFTYWPHHVQGVTHLTYNASEWIPWTLWAALRAYRRINWKYAALAGALLGSALWQSYYVTVFCGMLWVVLTLTVALADRPDAFKWAKHLSLAALTLLVSLVVALWPLIQMLRSMLTSDYVAYPGHNIYVADLVSILMPNPSHPLWGEAVVKMTTLEGVMGFGNGFPDHIGYVGVVLGLIALFKSSRRRAAIIWWLAWGGFLLLAFGEYLHIGGQTEFPGPINHVPLPFHWLKQLPVFDNLRNPARFLYCVIFCQAILAGFGLEVVLSRLKSQRAKLATGAVVAALVFVEFLCAPHDWHNLSDNNHITATLSRQLAQEEMSGSLIEFPLRWEDDRGANAQQIIHGRTVFCGHVSRMPARNHYWRLPGMDPWTMDYIHRWEDPLPEGTLDDDHWRRFQWQFNLTHILAHPDWSDEQMALLPSVWGPELIGTDGGFRLFRLQQPEAENLDLDMSEPQHWMHLIRGFELARGDGSPIVSDHAQALLRGQPGLRHRVTLRATAPRLWTETIVVHINGEEQGSLVIENGQEAELVCELPASLSARDGYLWIDFVRTTPGRRGLRPVGLLLTHMRMEILDGENP